MKRNKFKRLLTSVLALMAIAWAPFLAWGSSFNAFPPALKGLKDIAVSEDRTLFALREAPFPFKQIWVFDSNGNFLNRWGDGPRNAKMVKQSEINKPTSIAVNSRGRVYIVNSGPKKRQRISIFDPELDAYKFSRDLYQLGNKQFSKGLRIAIAADDALVAIDSAAGSSWIAIADEEGRIKGLRRYDQSELVDVAADDAGNIYAIDAKEKTIVQFDSSGNPVSVLQGNFEMPTALAVDEGGSLFVLDKKTHKLYRLGGSEEISSWGEFTDPIALAAFAGKIYVADDRSISIFNKGGRFIQQIGGSSFRELWGLCHDGEGNIYVANSKRGRVQKFDASGNLLSTIGEGVLDRPTLVAARDGELFVLDGGLMKLVAFSPDGTNVAWDLPATLKKFHVADLRFAPGGDFLLLLQRESFLEGARLWEFDIDGGAFKELTSVSSLGGRLVGLSQDGTVFVKNAQRSGLDLVDLTGRLVRSFPGNIDIGDVRFTKPTLVTGTSEDTMYVVDHPGPVSNLRQFSLEGGEAIKQWKSWGSSPELPFGELIGMVVNPDGSFIMSDAFWGVVLHLAEDAQGRLIPAGAVELPLPEMVTKRPKTRVRPEPTIEEIETEEAPASKKTRYAVIALILLSILLTIAVWRRRRRR